jgi:membrane peptidoglycan carboxypeptidase
VRRDLTAMLYNVVTSGTGTAARLGAREAAGKTGTTQDYRDAWFIGFTSDYVASVWVGNDDNHPMRKVTGGLVPALLWKDMMTVAENGLPPQPLDRSEVPAEAVDSVTADQVSYVDDADSVAPQIAAAPQVPQDQKGDFLAGSGVAPTRTARNETDTTPAAPPPDSGDYVPPRPPANRPSEENRAYEQWRQAEPPAGSARESAAASPYPSRNYPQVQAAEPPRSSDQSWQPVRAMPYQAYREQPEPPRNYGPPAAYATPPAAYYSAPPAYYQPPRGYYPPSRYDDEAR